MRKVTIALTLMIFSSAILSLVGQDYKSAIGVRAGTNFTLSYKQFVSESSAFEAFGGITRTGGQSLLTGGIFYEIHNVITSDIPHLKWYYGGGAFIALGRENISNNFALAAITGMEYVLEAAPINLFIDATPYVSLSNDASFDIEANIGVRFIF